jgi:hypothetical protein
MGIRCSFWGASITFISSALNRGLRKITYARIADSMLTLINMEMDKVMNEYIFGLLINFKYLQKTKILTASMPAI